jgi:hypothetical protein
MAKEKPSAQLKIENFKVYICRALPFSGFV